MDNNVMARRLALMAANGAFIFFVEHLVWDSKLAHLEMVPGAKRLAVFYVSWLLVSAGFAYGSLVFHKRRGAIFEGISAAMLVLSILPHLNAMFFAVQ